MCEHPGVYRGLRAGDAVVLGAAALALIVVPGSAGARSVAAGSASGPAATVDALAFERQGGAAVLRSGGADLSLPGSDPTIAGPYVATIEGDEVRLMARGTLDLVARVPAPGADSVSAGWLAYRAQRIPATRSRPEGGGLRRGRCIGCAPCRPLLLSRP